MDWFSYCAMRTNAICNQSYIISQKKKVRFDKPPAKPPDDKTIWNKTGSYTFVDHAYDAVVVGDGGAGLKAAIGLSEHGFKTACIIKLFPTRSHIVAAQGEINAADRTGHAVMPTLYGQALKHNTQFFVEYFALDLIIGSDGRCQGVIALNMEDGTLHRFSVGSTILATRGYGRSYFSVTSAHTCTGYGDDPDAVIPRLMAAGEAACALVHGANRLGANSLLDIVIIGRACANRVAEIQRPGEKQKPLEKDGGEATIAWLDNIRNANGSLPTSEIRLNRQHIMQNNDAALEEGCQLIDKAWESFHDVKLKDPVLIRNSDLIETMEL